jgi:hypothetical protein
MCRSWNLSARKTSDPMAPAPARQPASTFLLSVIAIACTDRLLNTTQARAQRRHLPEEGV